MRNEALDKNKLNRLVDAMLVEMKGENMTGFKSKQAVVQAKLNDDDDIQDYKREWVGLTDDELMNCAVFKHFDYDPPYIDKDGAKHVGSYEVSLRATYENINDKLKQKNT